MAQPSQLAFPDLQIYSRLLRKIRILLGRIEGLCNKQQYCSCYPEMFILTVFGGRKLQCTSVTVCGVLIDTQLNFKKFY